jgi:endonuclease-3
VGRKTANVVLGVAYGIPSGVVVDTHVGRISRRLGLTRHDDAVKVESDLMELLPQKAWIDFSHRMIQHGRKICIARRPKCDACALASRCPRIGVTP